MTGKSDHAAAAKRRKYIAEHAGTQDAVEIASALGMTVNSVRKVAQRMHISLKSRPRKPQAKYSEAVASRIDEHPDRSQLDCMPNPLTGRNCRDDWWYTKRN